MRFTHSLVSRLITAMLVCVVITGLVAILLLEYRVTAAEQRFGQQELNKAMQLVRSEFGRLVNEAFMTELRTYTAETAEAHGLRVTVFDAHKNPVADSYPNLKNSDNLPSKPELQFGSDQQEVLLSRYSNTMETQTLWLTSRLWDNGAMVGFLRLGITREHLQQLKWTMRWSILFAVAATALILFLPAMYLSRKISKPVMLLARQLSRPLDSTQVLDEYQFRQDEIGLLSRSIFKSRQRYQRVFEELDTEKLIYHRSLWSLDEGVITIDNDERILFINPQAKRYFEADPKTCEGKLIWEVVRKHPIAGELHSLYDENSFLPRETRYYNNEGEERYARVMTIPLTRVNDTARVGTLFIIRDVTQMNKLLQSRDDLITNVSHELKTPLTAIRGITETMLDDNEMPENRRHRFLERILQQSERLQNIVTDLLQLVRIDADSSEEEIEDIDIRPIVEHTFENMAERAEMKNIEYEILMSQQPLVVMIRPNAVEQIVENLLDNAIKYTPEGGQISLRLSAQGGWALIEVSDTGMGIREEDVERIFERFYRTKEARDPSLEGTGLGLSIVKSMVDYYEGSIAVSSYPGKGSIFCVSLPLKPHK